MVGLIPLFAVGIIEQQVIDELPELWRKWEAFRALRPDLVQLVSRWSEPGVSGRRLVALTRIFRMTMLLRRMLDESEFLSPFGVRAISRAYLAQPYDFEHNGAHYGVKYEPGESESGLFGGNSNWRGPIWMPMNALIIRALMHYYAYYGDNFKIECPTGSGKQMNLFEVAREIADRLIRIFLRDENGHRPVYGNAKKFQTDPHWRDLILFYEYFHGDNGAGLGAPHQTGWTALVASRIDEWRR